MDNLKLQAASMGVDPSRIIFAPFVTWQKNVERGFAADLFLDTPMYKQSMLPPPPTHPPPTVRCVSALCDRM
jgi:hypothetical protein